MKSFLFFVLVALFVNSLGAASYEPTWESLDSRPIPQWWVEAKFGIFVHWGPYAVPAFAPAPDNGKFNWDLYSEWYEGYLMRKHEKFLAHHASHYNNAPYANFAAQFKAENFNPDAWAALFKKAGAKYTVLTSKHHDGYALWPSPESPYFNAKVIGSGRDLAGEFTRAMKSAGLKSGFYFSMLEYANPLYPNTDKSLDKSRDNSSALTIKEWNNRVNLPQLKELVENYEADIIWPDGEWDYPSEGHCSVEFLTWLYNESKMKESVVVNDRWGKGCRGKHGGHYTTEYSLEGGSEEGLSEMHPWEECRGIGFSFGYNQFETPDQYMTRERCIETLVSCVSRGGNLLLNVGPTADGRIPPIMQDRLLAMGAWLNINGEAIYATTAGAVKDAKAKDNKVYYTRKGRAVYAISFKRPIDKLVFGGVGEVKKVTLIGATDKALPFTATSGAIEVEVSKLGALPCDYAWVFKLEY